MSVETAYYLERPADLEWSWTARFRLPEALPRDDVLAEIDRSIQAIRYNPDVPWEAVALHGLSGVLLGPDGDHDAEQVRDVVFATDPSRKYGIRPVIAAEKHSVRTAEANNWLEVDIDGNATETDEVIDAERSLVRVIMGRNLDKYGGEKVATFEQARALLPTNTSWETQGGYLFSGRPGMKLYGELAIVAAMEASSFGLDDLHQLLGLAIGLNYQDRFVLETPQGAEVYKLNPKR